MKASYSHREDAGRSLREKQRPGGLRNKGRRRDSGMGGGRRAAAGEKGKRGQRQTSRTMRSKGKILM